MIPPRFDFGGVPGFTVVQLVSMGARPLRNLAVQIVEHDQDPEMAELVLGAVCRGDFQPLSDRGTLSVFRPTARKRALAWLRAETADGRTP